MCVSIQLDRELSMLIALGDRMVEESITLDLLDAHTRVTKTNFRLGWPSSPRDVVTISKTLVDQHTLIDITTSLPRSRHEPAYLRPAPPHVRAHISLLAWCIQLPETSTSSDNSPPLGKARITCFWSWNPKGAWAVGGGVPQHLPSLVVGLVDQVREGSEKVPVLLDYGPDVSIGLVGYDTVRDTLSVGYAIVHGGTNPEKEGLRRQIEFGLSSTQSWDVQISIKLQSGEESPSTLWSSYVGQAAPSERGGTLPKRLILRFAHAQLQADEELIRVKVSIESTSHSSSGIRINGIPVTIEPVEPHFLSKRPLLAETVSASGISLRSMSTMDSLPTQKSISADKLRAPARERNIASLNRRNYICKSGLCIPDPPWCDSCQVSSDWLRRQNGLELKHLDFTSLLQEPEAKWRPVADSRGVAVHQLNSIDKTLVVFRAEAVYVGVGIWDLFATIGNPGARIVWEKSHEDATLLDDVNELSDLWHFKSRAAWPVAARDSVMLRTTYKSPSSVHIFGFSVDDSSLFPQIPSSIDPNIIRTQIDLQGWSIESLSPNTTHVTLMEQSDPRGWSNKSSVPQVMMATLAGIGDFAIKHGAPPAATRLGGARALASRYDVERETFRFEYCSAETRRSDSSSISTSFPLPVAVKSTERRSSETSSLKSLPVPQRLVGNIECEIRCDADAWTNNFEVVIDPPQTSISALRRHRLSHGGGGLWLTIEHDPVALGSDRVTVTIRRNAPVPNTKIALLVNGNRVKVDIQDLLAVDVELLKKQKRGRPTRAPLDQPPALGTLRKRQSTLDIHPSPATSPERPPLRNAYSRLTMPITRLYSAASDTTRAAIIPMSTSSTAATGTPVDGAVRALRQLTRMHADRNGESTDPVGWQAVSERDGLRIERRVVPHVSEAFPVYRAGRIIEGYTAEDLSAAISTSRKDERFETSIPLEAYGHGITTSQITAHATFPFRSRSMLVASLVARMPDGLPSTPTAASHAAVSTIFHASTSDFDQSTIDVEPAKLNPLSLPSGRIILEGWILETIDPYSHEQYAIPSTRVLYVVAADYSGNIPLSVNNMLNASLPRSLLAVEAFLKTAGAPSRARLPAMTVLTPDTSASGPWGLDGLDPDRIGVSQRHEIGEYSMTIQIHPPSTSREEQLSPPLRHNDSRVSVNSARSTVIDLAEEIRGGRRDLTVLEVELGSAFLKDGCQILLRCVSLPIAQNDVSGDSSCLPMTMPEKDLGLSFKCSIVSLPPSVLQSASLDPALHCRYLLRVTLPTSGYEAPIADPLTGKTAPLPRPRWLLDLINDGAVVQLQLKESGSGEYIYNGTPVPVEDDKRRNARPLSKRLPQLISHTPGAISLEKPLAVAREYQTTKPLAGPEPTVMEELDLPVTVAPAISITAETASGSAQLDLSNKRYSFWKYPNIRLGRTTSNPTTVASSATPVPLKSATEGEVEPVIALQPPSLPVTTIHLGQPAVSLPVVLISCILCLLLGSLLRSVLSEADYVIYTPVGEVLPDGHGPWRELKRILEWRIGWHRDLVVAIARRR